MVGKGQGGSGENFEFWMMDFEWKREKGWVDGVEWRNGGEKLIE